MLLSDVDFRDGGVVPKLNTLVLRTKHPERQRAFYRQVFGMSNQAGGGLGYAESQLSIRFEQARTGYQPQPTDLYWKIAIAVPNIELAYEQLTAQGVTIGEPEQFRDIGYLTQAYDPEGFNVEIIEHWFKGHRPKVAVDSSLLGGGPHINLLTLRTPDISVLEPEILAAGMKALSVQRVEALGFTLYFYADTADKPPNPQLEAIENRTWVYTRPYTVLEVQHVASLVCETAPCDAAAGYVGTELSQCSHRVRIPSLKLRGGT